MYVQVKDLTGNAFVFSNLLQENLVRDLKSLVADKFGVAPARQRLIFKGKQLDDDNASLADCKIYDQCQIHLIVRVRHKIKYSPEDDETFQLKEEIKHLEKKLSDIVSQTRNKQDTCLHKTISFRHDTGYQCGDCNLIMIDDFDYQHRHVLDEECKKQLNQLKEDLLTQQKTFLETRKRFTEMLSTMQKLCFHADYDYQFGILDSDGNLNRNFEDIDKAKTYLKGGDSVDLVLLEQWVCKDCHFILGQREHI